jgi:hypothetical protein
MAIARSSAFGGKRPRARRSEGFGDAPGYVPFDPDAANLMFELVSLPLRACLDDRHLEQALLQSARVRVKVCALAASAHRFANASPSESSAPMR